MNNAKRESDLDLMIVTSKRTLWTTRLLVRIISYLNGVTIRRVGSNKSRNAVCFNLWMDEEHLEIPRKMRNLYTAHEVLQVMPLINRGYTFENFLEVNKWALEFWPNAKGDTRYVIRDKKNYHISHFLSLIVLFFEPVAYRLQRLYMGKRITRELIQPGRAFFHPIDWGKIILNLFTKKLVPLDKTRIPGIK